MIRPFLWCPDTTVFTEPAYTQEQMQKALNEGLSPEAWNAEVDACDERRAP